MTRAGPDTGHHLGGPHSSPLVKAHAHRCSYCEQVARAVSVESIEISVEEYEKLSELARLPLWNLLRWRMRHHGTWLHWPCPFCKRSRTCWAVGTMGLDEEGTPEPRPRQPRLDDLLEDDGADADVDDVDDAGGDVGSGDAGDGGDLGAWLTMVATAAIVAEVGESQQPRARGYRCPEHGIFLIPWRDGHSNPFSIWSIVEPGILRSRLARYMFCPGLTQVISRRSGKTRSTEVCFRTLEWEGDGPVGIPPGRSWCPMHGGVEFIDDHTQVESPRLVRKFTWL